MKCICCGGAAHPASGCQFTLKAILCGPCTREFFKWVRSHTNKKAKRKQTASAVSFYEAAASSIHA